MCALFWRIMAPMRTEPPATTFGPNYGQRTEWENLVLREALQASLGQISARVRGVSIEAGYDLIVVHACIGATDQATLDDLEELVGDMVASMDTYVHPVPDVELRLHEGDTDQSWSGYEHPRLYLMHWRAREDYVPE